MRECSVEGKEGDGVDPPTGQESGHGVVFNVPIETFEDGPETRPLYIITLGSSSGASSSPTLSDLLCAIEFAPDQRFKLCQFPRAEDPACERRCASFSDEGFDAGNMKEVGSDSYDHDDACREMRGGEVMMVIDVVLCI